MEKQQIIDYVMNSPANTNPNVLGTMLDGIGGGGVEMTTVFEDDITLTYDNSDSYIPAQGKYSNVISSNFTQDGILRLTYENMSFLMLPKDGLFNGYINVSDSTLPFSSIQSGNSYEIQGNFDINLQTVIGKESEFQTYCQTPHHLKIEWFTI